MLIDGPQSAPATFILAHGAGAGMETPFMNAFASGLAEADFRVIRFEFPYMQKIRATGKRRPPDAAAKLIDHYQTVLQQVCQTTTQRQRTIIGGKSLGARIASLIADDAEIGGLVALGFPFQAPGKPNPQRIAHLAKLRTPSLFLQGTRDPFGTIEQVETFKLSKLIQLYWLEDGNHDLAPRKSSQRTTEQNWQAGIRALVKFGITIGSASI